MTREDAWVSPKPQVKLDYNVTQRIVSAIYGSKYQFLANTALQRIADTNYYYNYYDLSGQYWDMPHSLGYKPLVMPVNLCRRLTRAHVAWMFNDAPDIECPPVQIDSPEDMETDGYKPSDGQRVSNDLASSREKLLYSTWTDNSFEEKLLEGGRDYFIGGTVALKLRYLKEYGIRLDFAPAQEVFPVPNEDVPDIFDSITFASFYDNDKTIWMQTWRMSNGRCLLDEGYYDLELRPTEMKYSAEETGLDFIPVLIFPREKLTGDVYGTSYLKDLIPLWDQYSRMLSDASDSLRFNLFAVTVLLNAAPDADKNLKISPGEVWNIGGDDLDVKKLESSFQYNNALADFLNRLENLIHMIGDVPKITPEDVKGFGQITGIGLKMLYSDLVASTQADWRVWKSRLVKTNEYILKMAETFKVEGYEDINGNYSNRIIPHLPLPENEAEKVQIEAQKLSSSLQSVQGALEELGEKNPLYKIAQIVTERERFVPTGKKISIKEQDVISGA